jgi:glycosyltransferase involved in cell wall biosynthesis
MGLLARLARDHHPLRDAAFDRWGSRLVDECDLFHGWSHQCLHSLERARALGAVTLVERQSSHERVTARVLQEEYDRWGFEGHAAVRPLGLERGLAEYETADYIVVPSPFVHAGFLREGVAAERLFLVPNGVDVDHFTPATVSPRPDRFVLLFAGQVSLRKGIPYLLQAWRRLGLPGAELWLAGRVVPNSRALAAAHAGDPTIRFLGQVRDLRPLYRQASAFVLPSIEEGSALVTYEAMACGLPLIYTYPTGAVARDGVDGIEIPGRDVDALAAAIERLYREPELRRVLGHNGRRQAEAYTWRRAAERLLAAYEKAVAGREASPDRAVPARGA